ncbi:MAG: hotdog domain-containing protein, partial [Pseudomonadota bacterium]
VSPVRAGATLVIKAAVNRSWRSSMEIGVRVVAENSLSGDTRHIVSAYLTFVALDEDGRSTAVPPLNPETDEEKRRFDKAERRRAQRLANR